jgi:hypothetical protein
MKTGAAVNDAGIFYRTISAATQHTSGLMATPRCKFSCRTGDLIASAGILMEKTRELLPYLFRVEYNPDAEPKQAAFHL